MNEGVQLMKNKVKAKKRLRIAIKLRKKARLKESWRNIFVKSGYLKERGDM
jgi:hypothetical protein